MYRHNDRRNTSLSYLQLIRYSISTNHLHNLLHENEIAVLETYDEQSASPFTVEGNELPILEECSQKGPVGEASNQYKLLHSLYNSHHSYLPYLPQPHHLSISVHHPQLQHSKFSHRERLI